jgi:hypothetical protein
MTVQELNLNQLTAAGKQFFSTLDDDASPIGARARAGLTLRGYYKVQPDGTMADQVGRKLFQAYKHAKTGKTGAGAAAAAQSESEQTAETKARTWLRDIHAEVLSIRRGGGGAVLRTLQTLGDLQDPAALDASLQQMIDWLKAPEVTAALKPYDIGEADLHHGVVAQKAWNNERSGLVTSRGERGTANRDHVEAHQAFRDWLKTWWGIAKVRFKNEPAVLKALGIDPGGRRSRKSDKTPGMEIVPT